MEVGTINGTIHETPIIKKYYSVTAGFIKVLLLSRTDQTSRHMGRGVGALQVHSIAEKLNFLAIRIKLRNRAPSRYYTVQLILFLYCIEHLDPQKKLATKKI